jgi:hypothetical protein
MFGDDSNKSKFIQEETERRLNSGNARYHSVQMILSSHLLSKNINIVLYRTKHLHVVLYGCEIWSLTLREGHRMRVFENRVLRRIFGPKRYEVVEVGEGCRMRSFVTSTLRQV